MGMGIVPVAAANEYRTTSATATLKSKPDNLTVWTSAPMKRVIFDGTNAKGVELIDGRKGLYLPIPIPTDTANAPQPTQPKKQSSQPAPLTRLTFLCSPASVPTPN